MRHEKLFRTNQAERKWESIRVSVFKTLDYPTRKEGHGERRAKKNSNEGIITEYGLVVVLFSVP